jgi:hypothetical protein
VIPTIDTLRSESLANSLRFHSLEHLHAQASSRCLRSFRGQS